MRLSLALALAATIATPVLAEDAAPQRLSDDVRVLASPEYGGRAPGTPGEKKTLDWLVARFTALGLQPGGPDGQWLQKVPLIHTRVASDARMSIGRTALTQGKEIAVTTVRDAAAIAIKDSPMVFVGYGVSAPEAGWDDFKGIDLRGKTLVFLVNDPDFEAQPGDDAKGKFGDRRMTYYGRWTYKFEEAARRGASMIPAARAIHGRRSMPRTAKITTSSARRAIAACRCKAGSTMTLPTGYSPMPGSISPGCASRRDRRRSVRSQ